jgi:uncharacterized protein YcbK (DUF882 family)
MSERSRRKGLIGITVLVGAAPLVLATTATESGALQALAPVPLSIQRSITIEPLPSPEVPVVLENVNSGERATFRVTPSGHVTLEQAQAFEDFFRCRRTNKHRPMAAGVLALLADVATRWPGRVVEVVSGFRAPPYGVPHSRHFQGHAIDLRVRGVRTTELRDYLWRSHRGVGVGYYAGENFVHMDWRPDDKDTAWSGKAEGDDIELNPGWAWRARHARRSGTGALARR